ncbi:hypothetical protein GCM10023115_00350 [Pontixanthobacter gangjinensis]|uniref:DUF2924 domain-containing protein n=1 Tax=Pontixanthobacter gangjinensis TaxID=1028742 RepID=A0A6I4SJF8_9SPHN|nr:DUF2924 domain-containing protein [Pontixanthobacter gangjinensis]MXO55286.1 DUF2924 domain-containing protein [Pontixanthobacter gangjinensis]
MGLDDKIGRLVAMTSVQKKAEWRRVFGSPAPPAFGIALMTRAIAARYQEKALGGLTKAELRMLEVQSRKDQRHPRGVRAASAKPGTWLSRTWHGEVHEVVVLEGAFEYRGDRYRSLTSIAKHITGAAWSGPRFFGLHSPRLGALGVTRHG